MRSINIALLRSAHSLPRILSSIRWGLNHAIIFSLLVAAPTSPRAQEPSTKSTKPSELRSEVIAPGVEHLQLVRGFKSDKEGTGPWFINMLRIDLTRARLRLVHALDEAVGLETVSSMAARHGALAAVNSGYFRTTGTYRGDSVGVEVLEGKIVSESNNARAALGLIEKSGAQELIFGHVKFEGAIIAGSESKLPGRARSADEQLQRCARVYRED